MRKTTKKKNEATVAGNAERTVSDVKTDSEKTVDLGNCAVQPKPLNEEKQ